MTVVCTEGWEDVLSTSVAAASRWAKVDTWPLIHDGRYHVSEVRGPCGWWDLWWWLLFKITWSLWNYCSYIVNISSLIFPSTAHLKKQGRKMILGLIISKVYVNWRIVCKFSEKLSQRSVELLNSDYFFITTNISLTRDFVSICQLSMISYFYSTLIPSILSSSTQRHSFVTWRIYIDLAASYILLRDNEPCYLHKQFQRNMC